MNRWRMNPTIRLVPIIILSAVLSPLAGLSQVPSDGRGAATFSVEEFGAAGDGATDDAPAVRKALAAALEAGPGSSVAFEPKTYRLGDNPVAWHCFPLIGRRNLVIEGNGATLICPEGNLAFHFEGGRNVTVRNLTIDTIRPTFTQGEVIAVRADGSLDVMVMDGYPEPPDDAFLAANGHAANGHAAHGGGGRHMIVFANGGRARNTRMDNDHLYIGGIKRVSPGVFRFHVEASYLSGHAKVTAGDRVTYGFNKANLPAAEHAAKDRSASIYAQIAADRVENMTIENVTIFGSINGGIRVSDIPGDVTLRGVRIIPKPGTRNLLSIPSDALHLMNIRGRVIIENCVIETPGDDCLNLGAQRDNLIAIDPSNRRKVTLRTTDNRYYRYTIRPGDRLQFLDPAAKRVLGERTVTAASDIRGRAHTVTLDQEVPGLVAGTTQVMNLDQNTRSTLVRNNTITPCMRHAMLARARNMRIENNRIDCSRGGVFGLNLSLASGQDDAGLRNVHIASNRFVCPANIAIIAMRPYGYCDGRPETRDVGIVGNAFHVANAKAIRIQGVLGLTVRGNQVLADGAPVPDPREFAEIRQCPDAAGDWAEVPLKESGPE